jgi:hypothetical protein
MKDITPERFKCAIGTCPKIELDGDTLVLTGPRPFGFVVTANDLLDEATIRLPLAMVKEALEALDAKRL